jgi:hypothetical protein
LSPTGGLKCGDKFIVDAAGNLQATSAVFDTSLAVKSKRDSTSNVFEVNSTGDIIIHGSIYAQKKADDSDRIVFGTTTHKTTGILIYGNDLGLYSD